APGEIAIGVIIGRTSEFFDFFVYAIASVLVFPQIVFPFVDRTTGTLYAFALFSLAFIARPIGSVIFMAVDRRYGRGVKLTIAIFLLGGSTAAMAFLPRYSEVGVASIFFLAVARFAQGIALGGAWDGLASLLTLNAPEGKRGWYAMMPQLGAPLGLLLACALFAFFAFNLNSTDFLDWGWRYPFFVAFAVNVVALFARLRLVVTNEFANLLESRDLEPTRVGEMFKHEGMNVLLGAFAPLASFAMFHLVTVFPLSWVSIYRNRDTSEFLQWEMAGAFVAIVTIAASGLLADKIGRRKALGWSAGAIAVFSFFAPFLLGSGQVGEAAFMLIGFGVFGLSFGQASGAVASNFSKRFRYTGSALTSDLSWLIGAGFAPLIVLAITSKFGLVSIGGYLLSGAICTLVALRINRTLANR
ncbi:MAG: MFS transporter, partial [Caulobacteraceae bacterium]